MAETRKVEYIFFDNGNRISASPDPTRVLQIYDEVLRMNKGGTHEYSIEKVVSITTETRQTISERELRGLSLDQQVPGL